MQKKSSLYEPLHCKTVNMSNLARNLPAEALRPRFDKTDERTTRCRASVIMIVFYQEYNYVKLIFLCISHTEACKTALIS